MKRILIIAIALQVLKDVALHIAVNYFTGPSDGSLYHIALYVLVLPEMLVSSENGPYGIAAKLVMFTAGAFVNAVVLAIAFLVWKSIKTLSQRVAPPA